MALIGFKAPALPVPPTEYDPRQQMDVIRALRLYFNLLDSLTPNQAQSYSAEAFYGGEFFGLGHGLSMPYLCVQDLADQYLDAALTPKRVSFNSVIADSELFYIGNDGMHVIYPGIYNIQYSLQLVNTINSQHYAWVWLRKNGVDVPGSATKFSVPSRKSALESSYICAISNVVFSLKPSDYIEVWWAADAIYVPATSDGIYMEYYGANSEGFNHPSVPSAIVTMTFLSNVPSSTVTGVVALGQIGTPTVTGSTSGSPSGVSGSASIGSVTVSIS